MTATVFGSSKDLSNRERVVASAARHIEVRFRVDVDVLNFREYSTYDINGLPEILFRNPPHPGVMQPFCSHFSATCLCANDDVDVVNLPIHLTIDVPPRVRARELLRDERSLHVDERRRIHRVTDAFQVFVVIAEQPKNFLQPAPRYVRVDDDDVGLSRGHRGAVCVFLSSVCARLGSRLVLSSTTRVELCRPCEYRHNRHSLGSNPHC